MIDLEYATIEIMEKKGMGFWLILTIKNECDQIHIPLNVKDLCNFHTEISKALYKFHVEVDSETNTHA